MRISDDNDVKAPIMLIIGKKDDKNAKKRHYCCPFLSGKDEFLKNHLHLLQTICLSEYFVKMSEFTIFFGLLYKR